MSKVATISPSLHIIFKLNNNFILKPYRLVMMAALSFVGKNHYNKNKNVGGDGTCFQFQCCKKWLSSNIPSRVMKTHPSRTTLALDTSHARASHRKANTPDNTNSALGSAIISSHITHHAAAAATGAAVRSRKSGESLITKVDGNFSQPFNNNTSFLLQRRYGRTGSLNCHPQRAGRASCSITHGMGSLTIASIDQGEPFWRRPRVHYIHRWMVHRMHWTNAAPCRTNT